MAVQNSLQRSRGNQILGISAYLTADAVKNQINQVVGGKDGQRFISAIVSAVNTNPALAGMHEPVDPLWCTPGRVTETLTFAAAWPVLSGAIQ